MLTSVNELGIIPSELPYLTPLQNIYPHTFILESWVEVSIANCHPLA